MIISITSLRDTILDVSEFDNNTEHDHNVDTYTVYKEGFVKIGIGTKEQSCNKKITIYVDINCPRKQLCEQLYEQFNDWYYNLILSGIKIYEREYELNKLI